MQLPAVPASELPEPEPSQSVKEARSEYAFRCRLCGSSLYAPPSREGTEIQCPDCHSANVVPPPPVKPPPRLLVEQGEEYRIQDEPQALDPQVVSQANADGVRLFCGVCHCMFYARQDQAGDRVPCPDCGSAVKVRAPTPVARTRVVPTDPGIEVAPTVERTGEVVKVDRFLEAGRAYADRIQAARAKPPKRPFWDGVYRFPFYLGVWPRWVALSSLAYVASYLFGMAMQMRGKENVIAIFVFIIGTAIVATIVTFTATTLMAILRRTAAGYDVIDDWTAWDIFEKMINVMYPTIALAICVTPFFVAGQVIGQSAVGGWLALASVVLFYPVILLSLTDNNSPLIPYSGVVWKSLRVLARHWLWFYLASLPSWLMLLASLFLAVRFPGLITTIAGIIVPFVFAVLYFRLLGRLAWVLDRHYPEELLPESSTDET